MIVYRSNTSSSGRIMAHPLDLNGNPLLTEPVQLDIGYVLNAPSAPTVAWNGSLYMVAWATSTGVVAQRIAQDGTLIDPAPIPVMVGFGRVDISALGDTFLVVAMRYQGNPQYIGPYGVRVRGTDGVVLDGSPILAGVSYTRSVAVTTFDTRWLVVSHATYTHDDSVGNTVGMFVYADGTTGSAFNVYGPYSMGGNGLIEVAVASSGNNALVLQSVELTSGVETDLIGSVVSSSGSVISSTNLTPRSGNQYRGRVAWDGDRYIVVFNEQVNRFAPWTMDQLDARSDLFAMRIMENGSVIDLAGFAFSTSPVAEAYPNLVSNNGTSILLGSIMKNEPPYAAYRIGYWMLGADGNDWPIAVASSNLSAGDVPLTVSFSSNGSADPDGNITGYAWDFGDGTSSTDVNPSHTYTIPGKYVVTLTVTDNNGGQSINTKSVAATAPNLLPIAIAEADPPSGSAPLDVVFYAAGSYDPDGWLGNFYWSFSDGGDYWGPTAYHTFYADGIYTAELTVYDQRGTTGTTSITIYVGQPNQAPVAMASATPLNGPAPLNVDFSSSGSYDPDGTISSYAWVFGDGGTSGSPNPSHTYMGSGSYPVTLTVTDNLGATNTVNLEITVYDSPVFSIFLPMLTK
jgi:PKD repeat protein